jgi:hypothetical protein
MPGIALASTSEVSCKAPFVIKIILQYGPCLLKSVYHGYSKALSDKHIPPSLLFIRQPSISGFEFQIETVQAASSNGKA